MCCHVIFISPPAMLQLLASEQLRDAAPLFKNGKKGASLKVEGRTSVKMTLPGTTEPAVVRGDGPEVAVATPRLRGCGIVCIVYVCRKGKGEKSMGLTAEEGRKACPGHETPIPAQPPTALKSLWANAVRLFMLSV